jgi:hypothetical protein
MSLFNARRRGKTFQQLDISAVTKTLEIREYYAEKGDVHEFVVNRDINIDDLAQISVHVEGEVEVYRSEAPEVIRRIEKAGNTSNEYVWNVARRGKTIHRVTTDTYRYYCITDHLFRKLRSKTIRFDEAQSHQASPGVLVFVAMGSITVDNTQLAAPALFEVPTREESVVLYGQPGALVLEIEKLQ